MKAEGYTIIPKQGRMTALRAENLKRGMTVWFDGIESYNVLRVDPAPTGPKSVHVTLKGSKKEYVRSFRKAKMIGVPGLTPPD